MREVPSGTRISAFIKGTPESVLDPYTMRGHIEKVLAVSQEGGGGGGPSPEGNRAAALTLDI